MNIHEALHKLQTKTYATSEAAGILGDIVAYAERMRPKPVAELIASEDNARTVLLALDEEFPDWERGYYLGTVGGARPMFCLASRNGEFRFGYKWFIEMPKLPPEPTDEPVRQRTPFEIFMGGASES